MGWFGISGFSYSEGIIYMTSSKNRVTAGGTFGSYLVMGAGRGRRLRGRGNFVCRAVGFRIRAPARVRSIGAVFRGCRATPRLLAITPRG